MESFNAFKEINKDREAYRKRVQELRRFKANNQLEWVARMNNIKNRAEEIIFNELIYV